MLDHGNQQDGRYIPNECFFCFINPNDDVKIGMDDVIVVIDDVIDKKRYHIRNLRPQKHVGGHPTPVYRANYILTPVPSQMGKI